MQYKIRDITCYQVVLTVVYALGGCCHPSLAFFFKFKSINMNIYKFSNSDDVQIVVAENVGDAAKKVTFDWKNVRCLYKDVIVVK